MDISVKKFSLRFRRGVEALCDVSFDVSSGEFVTLLGPSGCGKSTILNAIASLIGIDEAQTEGEILIGGIDITKSSAHVKKLGYVFQRDSLLPWRTVLQNVESGLEIRGVAAQQTRARARQLLRDVDLAEFENYYPHQLSGGMRQRISLIRTLAYDPELILMDEPFGALDAQTRLVLQDMLLRIWEKSRQTIMFVTHDLNEAITLGERVIVFTNRPGRVMKIYPIRLPKPRDPFALPSTQEFVELYRRIWDPLSQAFRSKSVLTRP